VQPCLATCSAAPALPCALRHRTLHSCKDGLWCCHVPCGSRPRPSTRMGSGAITCPAASDLTSLPGWALALPRVPWPRTSPPCQGGLRCCQVSYSFGPRSPAKVGSARIHVSYDSLRAAGVEYKERPSYAARLACFLGMPVCFQVVWHPSHYGLQDARAGGLLDMWIGGYNATPTLLTTHKTLP
jgi:hypothetical protein